MPVDFEVRRSNRLSDQMAKNDGPAVGTIDLTSDQENDDVAGMNELNCNNFVVVYV